MNWTQLRHFPPVIGRLGIRNVAIVALYRFALKFSILRWLMPAGSFYGQQIFRGLSLEEHPAVKPLEIEFTRPLAADNLCLGQFRYFSFHEMYVGNPPNWFENPFKKTSLTDVTEHWSRIGDFDSGVGDIKVIWELSRFTWAPDLARAYMTRRDEKYINCLNRWVSKWIEQNPVNIGPNWKCGQETGIRLLHVLLAAYLMGQHRGPDIGIIRFVMEHCRRIEPTIRYALAQNNNHGTSEAAALYIGGTWLSKVCSNPAEQRRALRWANKGRDLLVNRVTRLIAGDGSFSQYSLVYHRLLVDTLCIVEFWRRELGDKEFPESFIDRSRLAVEWLGSMVDPISGDAPNLGANDGSSLFRLHDCSYRDFRPTVQLGSVLFRKVKWFKTGPWDEPLSWLGLNSSKEMSTQSDDASRQFEDGGYVLFRPSPEQTNVSWGVLRYPNYRFRPDHADGLHLDIWCRGINILRDSGSYSYNAEAPWANYFGATCAHNTIELDGRDQMPKLKRFLRGAWLKMQTVNSLDKRSGTLIWSGAYKDYAGGYHHRTVECDNTLWKVTDLIDGIQEKAVLRWRLSPDNWQTERNLCFGALAELQVESSVPVRRSELVEGWESLYYLQKSKLPVWEIEIGPGQATLTTYIKLK